MVSFTFLDVLFTNLNKHTLFKDDRIRSPLQMCTEHLRNVWHFACCYGVHIRLGSSFQMSYNLNEDIFHISIYLESESLHDVENH